MKKSKTPKTPLEQFRDNNYLKESLHYKELTRLIKEDNKDALKQFGVERLLEDSPRLAVFEAALEGKVIDDPKPALAGEETEDDEEDEDEF